MKQFGFVVWQILKGLAILLLITLSGLCAVALYIVIQFFLSGWPTVWEEWACLLIPSTVGIISFWGASRLLSSYWHHKRRNPKNLVLGKPIWSDKPNP